MSRLAPHNSKRALFFELIALAVKEPRTLLRNLTFSNLRVLFREGGRFEPSALGTEIRNKLYQRGPYSEELSAVGRFDYFRMLETPREEGSVLVIGDALPAADGDPAARRLALLLQNLRESRCKVTFLPAGPALRESSLPELQASGVRVVSGDMDPEDHFRQFGPSYAAVILSEAAASAMIPLARAYAVNASVVYDAGEEGSSEVEKDGKFEALIAAAVDQAWTASPAGEARLLRSNPDLAVMVVPAADLAQTAFSLVGERG